MTVSDRPYLEAALPGDAGELAHLESRITTHPWSRAQFETETAVPGPPRTLVLREAGPKGPEIVAFLVLQVVADEGTILNVGVQPEARRRGHARCLVRLALRLAASRGARTVYLEVREGNSAARRLYEALGFVERGRRRGYYSCPVEDALLMSRVVAESTTDGGSAS